MSSRDKVEIATLRFNVNRHVCRNGVIRYLEHVQLRVDLRYHRRALIAADITSPGGTKSKVLYARQLDFFTGASNFTNWTTMSVHFWGEQSEGNWTISFKNGLPFFGRGNGELNKPANYLFDKLWTVYGDHSRLLCNLKGNNMILWESKLSKWYILFSVLQLHNYSILKLVLIL